MALTPKQEKFCKVYRETGNASEAYRQSYDASAMNSNTINRKAFDVLENGKIRARLLELGQETAKRHAITVDDLIAELEEARQAALCAETAQSAAAVGATMGKAKLLGMDKVLVDLRTPDGIQVQTAEVSNDELQESLKRIGLGRTAGQLDQKIADK